jgi:hypothetical protein
VNNTDTQRIDWLIKMAKLPETERCILATTQLGFVVIKEHNSIEGFTIPEIVGDHSPDLRTAIDDAMRNKP